MYDCFFISFVEIWDAAWKIAWIGTCRVRWDIHFWFIWSNGGCYYLVHRSRVATEKDWTSYTAHRIIGYIVRWRSLRRIRCECWCSKHHVRVVLVLYVQMVPCASKIVRHRSTFEAYSPVFLPALHAESSLTQVYCLQSPSKVFSRLLSPKEPFQAHRYLKPLCICWSSGYFPRHPSYSTDTRWCIRLGSCGDLERCLPKVAYFGFILFRDEDVERLQVAVNTIVKMKICRPRYDIFCNIHFLLQCQLFVIQNVPQGTAFCIVCDQAQVPSVSVFGIVLDNISVPQFSIRSISFWISCWFEQGKDFDCSCASAPRA